MKDANTVSITKNEILTALNKPDAWRLASEEAPTEPDSDEALIMGEERQAYGALADYVVRYMQRPFTCEPDFDATRVNYDRRELWATAVEPE